MLSDIIKIYLNPTTQNWIDLYILDMRIFLGVGYKGGHRLGVRGTGTKFY